MTENNKTHEAPRSEYYFGYGSNIHPCRLKAKDRAPFACFIGIVPLAGYILKFNKKSTDGSGKGNIVETGLTSDLVYGAVYAMTVADKERLSETENGYKEVPHKLSIGGVEYPCFTFVAEKLTADLQPYHWYREWIVLGAERVGFPADYIDAIKAKRSKPDPCDSRREKNEKRIKGIRQSNSA